jgi:hypothetical protein
MDLREREFRQLVGAVIRRFFAQNSQPPPPDAEIGAFGARLWATVEHFGLPVPPTPGGSGAASDMTEAEFAPLVAPMLAVPMSPSLAEAAKQLVKACFYPEFRTCRESYRAVSANGACRRQELERAQKRVSGSHCVDCPYWQDLEPEAHTRFLAAAWCGNTADFETSRGVFLPEDFRALRRWVRASAADFPRR